MPRLSDDQASKARIRFTTVGVIAACLFFGALDVGPAAAEAPWWHLTSSSVPTHLPLSGEGKIAVAATNLGDVAVNGASTPVTITDKLPSGLTATAIFGNSGSSAYGGHGPVECSLSSLSCTFSGTLPSYEPLKVEIVVKVETGASSNAVNEATIAGGEAPGASVKQRVTLDGAPTPFGIEKYELTPENEGGAPDTQAGSHPFQVTSTLAMNQTAESVQGHGIIHVPSPTVPALAKDLHFNLPPGLIGNPTISPQCPDLQFLAIHPPLNACPSNTAVGVASVAINEPEILGSITRSVPLFNLVPEVGEPARFGFEVEGFPVILDTSVRTGGDYGVVVSLSNISQAAVFLSGEVTFWGVPSDPRHDQSRGWSCVDGGLDGKNNELPPCAAVGQAGLAPFLTLPTSCTGPLKSTVQGDSWAQPGSLLPPREATGAESLDGCNRLGFSPSIGVRPEGQAASTPTGLAFSVHVPQQSTLEASGLAESDSKDTTVTLPEGMQLSPAAADGLEACSLGQVGLESPGAPSCPEASKVGMVRIKTPLLANELEGGVYLAAQNANPFGSLIALYILAEDSVSGVRIKLAGKVSPNPATGQLVSTFENTPQLPFEDLRLNFFSGARAPLSTPPYCGTYTTTASFTPWSGNAPLSPSSSFLVTSGPNGTSCQNPLPFAPSLTAGSTSLQAGAFTPFVTTISREDGDQNLGAVQLHLPPGLLGLLASVTPCPEPQAAEGACGPQSLIGHTVVSVGLGTDPYTVSGQVFITGPYEGAPYGLSIVTPAIAGPFNLGTVIVRARIEVDPHTSVLSVTSDPLPQILQGIPLQIKRVHVTVDRPGFTFNPTNCSPLTITGTVSSTQGASASASLPFQVANCVTLPFQPKLTATTQGRTSKANGASLHVTVTSGPGQVNIAKTVLIFPKVLPTRLTTIQKACLAAVFEANPAACPEGSVIGTATIHTPILTSPLTGPGYLVSHGGAAFPDAEFVLQGEGITLILDGQTNIHNGITSSSFNAVPDAPFTSFDAVLPEGPHSAFAAYGNLCASTRVVTVRRRVTRRVHGHLVHVLRAVKETLPPAPPMPTTITAQNGAVIKQTTQIAVSGCHGVKSFKARKHKKRSKGKGK